MSLGNPPRPTRAVEPALPVPWWRVGMMWIVVGGPLLVVAASLATVVVAYRGADVVLTETASARHVPTASPATQAPAQEDHQPATAAAAH